MQTLICGSFFKKKSVHEGLIHRNQLSLNCSKLNAKQIWDTADQLTTVHGEAESW